MATSYNVDDILEEVRRKKEGSKSASRPPSSASGSGKKPGSAFNLSGMTDEFERQEIYKAPVRQSGRSSERGQTPKAERREIDDSVFRPAAVRESFATRTDIPVTTAKNRSSESEKTQVIPAVRSADMDLEQRRQQKVRQFMESSFSTAQREELPEEEDGISSDIAKYFGGMKRAQNAKNPRRAAQALASDNTSAQGRSAAKSAAPASRAGRTAAGDVQRGAKTFDNTERGAGQQTALRQVQQKRQQPREEDTEGEYKRFSDAKEVRRDILAIKRSLSVRLIFTGVCAVMLLYLSLCNLYPLPLLNPICPEVNMKVFLMVNLVILVCSALCANAVIGSGLISLFTFKADGDTPTAICVLAVIAHSVALIMNSSQVYTGESGFYFFIAALALFFNTVGKRMMIIRIEKNFACAAAQGDRVGEYILDNDPLANTMAQGQGFAEASVCYPVKVAFPEKFVKLSYEDSTSESLGRYTSPIFLMFSLGLALVCKLAFGQSFLEAVTIFCVVLCIASPLTSTISNNMPLMRACKKLTGAGGFISGAAAVEMIDDANCVALNANELYPEGSVELHGMKALDEARIDEAIADAASLMNSVDGLLKDAFMGMISGNSGLLKPVSDVNFVTGAGISATVGESQVLIGNRKLLSANGVDIPSLDFEKKYEKGGKKVLYVANSGVATAMLLVSYRPNAKIAEALSRFAKRELSLLVYSTDPNITERKIAADYRYPEEFIRVLPAELHDGFMKLTAPRSRGKAYMMSMASRSIRLQVLSTAIAVKQAITTGTVLQMAGVILGYAMAAFLAFTGSIASMGFGQLAIYQIFWCVACTVIANIKKF